MTADQVKGKGFKGALSYNLAKVEKNKATILASTFSKENDIKAILKEVNLVRMQRPNLAKYFYHTSLNFPVNESLKDEQMKTIAGDYLKEMGFGDNQHIIFRHFDAEHPHLHILVNRIGYDNSLVSDSNDYQRSEAVLRQLERKYGLTQVASSKEAKERAMTKDEWEMFKHTKQPSAKMWVQGILKKALSEKPDIKTLISTLEQHGVNVLFNQASTGFISGISYGYKEMQFKGAHLGNAYKWQAIKTATGYEQERDRTAIHEANLRTGSLKEQQQANRAAGQYRGKDYAETNGTGTGTGHAQNDTGTLRQDSGKLSQQPEQTSSEQPAYANTARKHGDRYGFSAQDGGRQRGTHQEGTEQGRQQVDNPHLPHSDLISSLLGTNNLDSGMAETEMKQSRRRRKKKRRGLSH